MSDNRNPDELGALWLKEGKGGKKYLSGTIAGQKVVVFKNERKSSDKAPDYRVLKAKPQGARQSSEDIDDDDIERERESRW